MLIPVATNGDEGEQFFYFKGKTRTGFNSPRLGEQYRAMGEWIPHMKQSSLPRIVELGKRIEQKWDQATQAIRAAEKAETSAREFRLTGARRQLIDRFNALGKATEGELKEMPRALCLIWGLVPLRRRSRQGLAYLRALSPGLVGGVAGADGAWPRAAPADPG